jgi:threonine/homoserine/homoserine lactone efflux protein
MLPVSSLIAFAIALTFAAGAPGPSVGALVARVLTRGFRDVLPFLMAMWIGEAMWLAVAVTGLATIAAQFAVLFTLFKLLGVAYLLFLAWRMWKAAGDAAPDFVPEAQSAWQMFLAGMMVTLGNPKIAVFYLALLPSLVDLRRITVGAWAQLTVIMLVVLMGIDLGWAAAAVRTRRLLVNRRNRMVANRVSASVMAAAAVGIAVH